jgi:hypothetical protein
MKDKHPKSLRLSVGEQQLIEQLRQHPDMMERMQSILSMAGSSGKTADEIEELLISEIQRLGQATMQSWAVRSEQQLAQELKRKDSSATVIKKNAKLVVRFWADRGCGAGMAYLREKLPASAQGGHWC